ncbi:uncharacterized protein G2W53_027283 [Senna tora]|uniref:Uncharacterized protein n=1 Tax=Senna tora TaxID=362788 RepID=A0A834TGU9_9FABA|nr:uncharacterized protein G2W53_027283 [Senna tora]
MECKDFAASDGAQSPLPLHVGDGVASMPERVRCIRRRALDRQGVAVILPLFLENPFFSCMGLVAILILCPCFLGMALTSEAFKRFAKPLTLFLLSNFSSTSFVPSPVVCLSDFDDVSLDIISRLASCTYAQFLASPRGTSSPQVLLKGIWALLMQWILLKAVNLPFSAMISNVLSLDRQGELDAAWQTANELRIKLSDKRARLASMSEANDKLYIRMTLW